MNVKKSDSILLKTCKIVVNGQLSKCVSGIHKEITSGFTSQLSDLLLKQDDSISILCIDARHAQKYWTPKSMETLLQVLKHRKLHKLSLRNIKLHVRDLNRIFRVEGFRTKLLDLSHNKLNNSIQTGLVDFIRKNPLLTIVDLSHNHVTMKGMLRMAKTIPLRKHFRLVVPIESGIEDSIPHSTIHQMTEHALVGSEDIDIVYENSDDDDDE